MKTLGICLGASTISIVEASGGQTTTARLIFSARHEGNPQQMLAEALHRCAAGAHPVIAATGRKICRFLTCPVIAEPEASEYALEYVTHGKEHFDALISCGGETFMAYALDKNDRISTAYTGNKCASGTGEFFLQQIRRMNLNITDALSLAKGTTPFKVAGRCSVFCKSDCTHALNRGEPKEHVVAGLSEMVALKILELISKLPHGQVILVGGVSRNEIVVGYLRQHLRTVYVPEEAGYFEALGAALWALKNRPAPIDPAQIFKQSVISFSTLPALRNAAPLVEFKELPLTPLKPYDECVIGLDVGSTTTKAVAIRLSDGAICASIYLRTLGQPVEAARNCYRDFLNKFPRGVAVVGLGVTGSGRQIAALHALTLDVINEIIAHAHAAAFFDPDVDTIFEIGGQDAKYTYLVNGVPCDYAMNEACSAGTGSFLEEACKETLGVEMTGISNAAMDGNTAPNFNDQCAAFISGDIKTAAQEGMKKEDIIAGLVYSICMNYTNRVKGLRPTGKKIFMQGGVCYIKAVPLAMASLLEKPIIVPPHPGLMGAFGVALEVRHRINSGISRKATYDLTALAERTVSYGKPFHCQSPECGRNCEIAVITVEHKKYPFGGACNKYYNLRFEQLADTHERDLVNLRQKLLFAGYQPPAARDAAITVGINRSFLTFSLFPLYRTFFEKLGFKVLLPDSLRPEGLTQQGAAFCYPAGVAHGFFSDLLDKKPHYLFLPQVAEIPVQNAISLQPEHQSTCHILQAEPYYLKTTFKRRLSGMRLLTPVFNFSRGYAAAEGDFIQVARKLGVHKAPALAAFQDACAAQARFTETLKKRGVELMQRLRAHPEETAIVLFGRFYNAFCPDINVSIPQKFSSRGITIVPFEFLPYDFEPYAGPPEFFGEDLTWATGQMILRAASFVQRHRQLFGVYITNFSCGPDSFLLTYFRQIMQEKPSLTLEIDSHTADAGITTRVEAFLDIVQRFRRITAAAAEPAPRRRFIPARMVVRRGKPTVISSTNREYSIFSRRVHLLIPSMGDLGTDALTAAFARAGVRTTAMGIPDNETLKLGRQQSSCKECLPLILCCGNLLKYLQHRPDTNELLLYFMPTVGGNCRFSQYGVFLKNMINRNRWENVAIYSMTSENGYVGFGNRFNIMAFKATLVADAFDDIRNTLRVLAKDQEQALLIFNREWKKIIQVISARKGHLEHQLEKTAQELRRIPLKYPLREARFVSLLGEIFVRKEIFSRQGIVERLAERQIIPRTASVVEWLYYVDYLVKRGIIRNAFSLRRQVEFTVKNSFQYLFEKNIKKILSRSGLYDGEIIDIKKLIEYGIDHVPLALTGEPIIIIGAALREVLHSVCGVISIGPFSCLPTRVTESILSKEMTLESKRKTSRHDLTHFGHLSELPFLSVEVDGNAFTPVMDARVEAFCLQAERVHAAMHKS
ncbi:MAG: acyl-CoA dehydratase activase [Candidatus Omnitrophica bacterium]|nr:acyl-CoA dehydratase activase [Candidatus Omnitrophota bacterium]